MWVQYLRMSRISRNIAPDFRTHVLRKTGPIAQLVRAPDS